MQTGYTNMCMQKTYFIQAELTPERPLILTHFNVELYLLHLTVNSTCKSFSKPTPIIPRPYKESTEAVQSDHTHALGILN
jgi:hypothetical protein